MCIIIKYLHFCIAQAGKSSTCHCDVAGGGAGEGDAPPHPRLHPGIGKIYVSLGGLNVNQKLFRSLHGIGEYS